MISILNGDSRSIPLADQSVQCVITSPPYWGLRDYGTAKWEGGDPNCTHEMRPDGGQKQLTNNGAAGHVHRDCKCGARRIDAQIGLEPTPAAYVASIVTVMRECWRVMKDDGTLWLNLGDSYSGGGGYYPDAPSNRNGGSISSRQDAGSGAKPKGPRLVEGLKQKDLVGIPWRVAFALQDAGWYLRQDIIWSKPNPMPESVTDRCTKAHEYVFLLTKQARYFYDAEAVKEAAISTPFFIAERKKEKFRFDHLRRPDSDAGDGVSRNRRSVWTVATQPYSGKTNFTCPTCNGTGYELISQMEAPPMTNEEWRAWYENADPCPTCSGTGEQSTNVDHFATFPPKLVEPMILAGTSQRGECPHCGKAWVRVVEVNRYKDNTRHTGRASVGNRDRRDADEQRMITESSTLGWRQQCDCPPHEPIPQTVLDPFAGSGTTGKVAIANGRRAVLLDLNTKYIDLQFERISKTQIGMSL